MFLYSGVGTVDSGTLAGYAAGMLDAKAIRPQIFMALRGIDNSVRIQKSAI